MKTFTPIPKETEKVATQIVDAAYQVHKALGPGLLESVYESCLVYELRTRNLDVASQFSIPIFYKDLRIDGGLKVGLLIQNSVIVEVKAVEELATIHMAQLMTYLKLTKLHLGFLMNFNSTLIKDGIRRGVC